MMNCGVSLGRLAGRRRAGWWPVAMMWFAGTALADDQTGRIALNFEAQPLPSALLELSQRAGIQLTVASALVRSLQAPALRGKYTTEEALARLLQGTGLRYHIVDARTIAIEGANRPTTLMLGSYGGILATSTGTDVRLAPIADESAGTPTPGDAAEQLQEVTVTARRREENLQTVPISVSVLNSEQLRAKGVTDALTLANHVPSLIINSANSGTMSKAFKVGIRGIQSSSNLLFDDPPSGTYFAEGVLAHPWGFGETMYDIQSVQVLKGPQGTLFGRNTTGGAVLIEPNEASIEDGFGGYAKVTFGDYDLQQFDGMVNIPLGDVAAIRIAGEHKRREGYTTNILDGQKLDGVGNDSGRVGFLIRPAQNVTSDTIIDYLNLDTSPNSAEVIAVFPPNGGFGLGGPLAASYAGYSRILAEQQARGPWRVAEVGGTNGPFDMLSPAHCVANPFAYCRPDWVPKETLTNGGVLNNTQVDLGGATVKNIVAYRATHHRDEDLESFAGGSPNGASLPPSGGGQADVSTNISQWQEELQLLGRVDNRFDWQTGVFLMREWGSEFQPSYTNGINWADGIGYAINESRGLFAQGTFAITDRLRLTLGDRENWDHREAEDKSNTTNTTTGVKTCQIRVGDTAAFLPISQCSLRGSKGWQANTWAAALDYRLGEGTLVYLKEDRGYHSGGFSLRTHREAQFSYNPEFVTNSEIGLKSDWSVLGRPIRTNLALFYLDYKNQQVQVTNPGTNPVTTYIANVGKSRIYGGELETTYKPVRGLDIDGYFSYSKPQYVDYSSSFARGGPLVDLSGRPFGLPLYSAGLSAAYTLPLNPHVGSVTGRADASYRSRALVDNSVAGLLGTVGAPPTAGFTQTPQSSYTLLNLRIDWQHPLSSPIDLAVFVTNVTNKAYIQGGTPVNGLVTANLSPPRMFGVEVNYAFGPGFKPRD